MAIEPVIGNDDPGWVWKHLSPPSCPLFENFFQRGSRPWKGGTAELLLTLSPYQGDSFLLIKRNDRGVCMGMQPLYNLLQPTLEMGVTKAVYVGLYWTAVVVEIAGEQRCGLAATMGDESHHFTNEPAIPQAGFLNSIPAHELASWIQSSSPSQVSIGMAAINALLPRNPQLWQDINAEEVIAKHGKDKNVALIGHFPFVPRLKNRVGNLWVLEQNPHPGDLPAQAADEILPQADIVAITSMTLLNRTFDHLITLPRKDALVLLLGPTTPLSPQLFELGVKILSGSVVEKMDTVIQGVIQGANFHQLHQLGVRLVSIQREGVAQK